MLVVEASGLGDSEAAVYAELKDVAAGGTLKSTLGRNYAAILKDLYRADDTLQSHTRTWAARRDGTVVGHISCIPSDEYAAAKKASSALIRSASLVAGARWQIESTRRILKRTALGPWGPGQLYIQSLAVREAERRQGVASELLAFASRLGRTRACTELSLNTLAVNHAALAFYEAFGFHVHERRFRNLKLIRKLAKAPA